MARGRRRLSPSCSSTRPERPCHEWHKEEQGLGWSIAGRRDGLEGAEGAGADSFGLVVAAGRTTACATHCGRDRPPAAGRRPRQGRPPPAPRRRHDWGHHAGMMGHGSGTRPTTARFRPLLTVRQGLAGTERKLVAGAGDGNRTRIVSMGIAPTASRLGPDLRPMVPRAALTGRCRSRRVAHLWAGNEVGAGVIVFGSDCVGPMIGHARGTGLGGVRVDQAGAGRLGHRKRSR